MKNWIRNNLWRHLVGVIVSFFALFPLYLVVISSFNPTGSLKITSFIPTEISFINYKKLFNDPTIPYLIWIKNTVVISTVVAVLSVIIGASSAFAFSRLKFKGKKVGIQLLFLIQMFPAILALSAVYVIMERVYNFAPGFGLGTQPGLLLVYLGGAMGVNIWLLKGFVDSEYPKVTQGAKDRFKDLLAKWKIHQNKLTVLIEDEFSAFEILFSGTYLELSS